VRLVQICMPDVLPAEESTQRAPAFATEAPTVALLRMTRSPRRVDAWALALTSKGIASLTRWFDGVCELYVASDDFVAASAELDATDEEERENQRVRLADSALAKTPVSKHATWGAALVALLLVAFFGVTGPRAAGSLWFVAGASDAERVLHGEWWRAVTALTLHADGAHVLSNVAIGTLVVGAVMREEGVGWGAALVAASGTLGNLMNAWAHQTLHSSVGFSTAVFGAIGLLGGLTYVRSRRHIRAQRTAWTALAGALALFALLGVSDKKQVDVLAHLFGAFAGVGLGLFTEWRAWRPQSVASQWLAGLGAAAGVLGAWWVALA
jgi:rhomboid protease GluP